MKKDDMPVEFHLGDAVDGAEAVMVGMNKLSEGVATAFMAIAEAFRAVFPQKYWKALERRERRAEVARNRRPALIHKGGKP